MRQRVALPARLPQVQLRDDLELELLRKVVGAEIERALMRIVDCS
jgi:hypothetical protein